MLLKSSILQGLIFFENDWGLLTTIPSISQERGSFTSSHPKSHFDFCYLENFSKDQLSKQADGRFKNGFFGPEKVLGLEKQAPWQGTFPQHLFLVLYLTVFSAFSLH